MKIAIYAPSWPPGSTPNGIVTYASHLVPALRRLGHEVYVLTGDVVGDRDPYTVDLRDFSSEPSLWDRAMFKLAPETAHFKKNIDRDRARYQLAGCKSSNRGFRNRKLWLELFTARLNLRAGCSAAPRTLVFDGTV